MTPPDKRAKRSFLGTVIVLVATAGLLVGLTWLPTPNFNLAIDSSHTKIGFATGSHVYSMSPAELDEYAGRLANSGTKIVRIDIRLSDARARARSSYKWSAADRVVGTLVRHGIAVHGIMDSMPAWATDGSCGNQPWLCPPRDDQVEAYLDFVSEASYRYCGALRWAENLNEPNAMKSYWENSEYYAEMHVRFVEVVKEACPTATAIPGGTAAIGQSSNDNGYRPTDWYTNLCLIDSYRAVGKYGNVHPYSTPAPVANGDRNSQWNELTNVHRVLKQNCQVERPIMLISEIGWPTNDGSGRVTDAASPEWSANQPISAYRQSEFIGGLFAEVRRLQSTGIAIEEVMIYSFQDVDSGGNSTEDYYGILNDQGDPKPLPPVDTTHPAQPTAIERVRAAITATDI